MQSYCKNYVILGCICSSIWSSSPLNSIIFFLSSSSSFLNTYFSVNPNCIFYSSSYSYILFLSSSYPSIFKKWWFLPSKISDNLFPYSMFLFIFHIIPSIISTSNSLPSILFSIFFDSKWNSDLNRFFTICSVRLPPKIFDTFDHFLPCFKIASTNCRSSWAVQDALTVFGFKWLIQCSLHCLAVLKYFLLEMIKSYLAISFHLFLILLDLD